MESSAIITSTNGPKASKTDRRKGKDLGIQISKKKQRKLTLKTLKHKSQKHRPDIFQTRKEATRSIRKLAPRICKWEVEIKGRDGPKTTI